MPEQVFRYACATKSHFLATCAGVAVDGNMNVLTDNGAIAGLYAAGEIVGGFHGAGYPTGTALGKAVTFGRIAGAKAAKKQQIQEDDKSGNGQLLLDKSKEGVLEVRYIRQYVYRTDIEGSRSMPPRSKESTRYVDAVMGALDILDCFLTEPRLSLKQIIDKTGLIRSRTMRLVGTFEHRHYLIYDEATNTYSLGICPAGLGRSFDRANNTETFVRPVLKCLVGKTGESATFYMASGMERVAVVREEGTEAIRLSIVEGQRSPIHVGASGKVLLAFGDQRVYQEVLGKKELSKVTENTITGADRLRSEVEIVRQQGYAVSYGENTPGAHAIAAPAFNYENQLVGAIGIAGPANNLTEDQIDRRIQWVMEGARMLSKRYGYKADRRGDPLPW